MKKYKTLLFDVDDTLLDFQAAEKCALSRLADEVNFSLTAEMEEHYKKINIGLWQSFENGEITRDEVLNTRFSIFFRTLGYEIDGILYEQKYRTYLGQGNQLVHGAYDLVGKLHGEYDLYIVTNGVSKTQNKRLHDAGVLPFFKGIFVSEDTGYQKPMKKYFDFVFNRIPHFNSENALIIGDSLSADIKGGNLVGIDTCWFNPNKKANNTNIVPTYEIHRLEDLHHILKTSEKTKLVGLG
ncbi:noncanonical pyrimidine nucleotidase, YjjG family [Bacillus sp. HMF5848]|uniref:YjjG family noncanonical pyrimidine nucleotidase n=1 Tax=Bacillus sp. HMF5848 TaxID=2495421 RepID=UPI000F7B8074|nr:YjjG family noncanonical pyrimidine nucleotidase [Bacillus sp. HMF5848]RSK27513.1 noncanonical pyrimidine nucleotidase, YjjG family [Bacillus sp. HMF5848]